MSMFRIFIPVIYLSWSSNFVLLEHVVFRLCFAFIPKCERSWHYVYIWSPDRFFNQVLSYLGCEIYLAVQNILSSGRYLWIILWKYLVITECMLIRLVNLFIWIWNTFLKVQFCHFLLWLFSLSNELDRLLNAKLKVDKKCVF